MSRTISSVFATGAALLLLAAADVHAQAIQTSTVTGTTVNANLFDNKEDVYLNGGPQGGSPKGFDRGYYYFVVTNPNTNELLSLDAQACRVLWVENERIYGTNAGDNDTLGGLRDTSCLHVEGQENAASGGRGVQLMPFADSPNNGGVYKVTIWPVPGQNIPANGNTKSDNFKVRLGDELSDPTYFITGTKWLADSDGEKTDMALEGWEIVLTGGGLSEPVTANTLADGTYIFTLLPAGTYTVCETGQNEYEQVHPEPDPCHTVTLPGADPAVPDASDVDFWNKVKTYKISGRKLYDSKGNGDSDDFLPGGLEGWTINLTKNGNGAGSDTTVAGGGYEFEVVAGTYTVCEVQQAGYLQSYPADDPENGRCHVVTVDYQTGDSEDNDFANYIQVSGKKTYSTADGAPVSGIEISVAGCSTATCLPGESVSSTVTTVCTDADGEWSVVLPGPYLGVFVAEDIPDFWEAVSPASGQQIVAVSAGTTVLSSINFVNVCYEEYLFKGYTLGFWSNRNGQRIIENNDLLAEVNPYHLRNGLGEKVTAFANYAAFRPWLLGGTASNMAYMLSVQMAATKLSVASSQFDGDMEIKDGDDAVVLGPQGETTVNQMIAAAAELLENCGDCLIVSGHPDRSLMEAYKDIFDKINNGSFSVKVYSSEPCENRSGSCAQ